MSIDREIIEDFINESKSLIEKLLNLLEEVEGDFSKVERLAEYGNLVDRIMGASKSLALMVGPEHSLHMISDYAEICKTVSYKASQITDNEQFFDICVALLLDATENLQILIEKIDDNVGTLKKTIPQAFIERLHFVSNQFKGDFRSSIAVGEVPKENQLLSAMNQGDIDSLLKKLGI